MAGCAPQVETGVDAARIEEAGLNALQTRRQLFYDGWLLRLTPGKAKRARSINAHFGSTLPLPVKIAHCEDLYTRHGLPPLFRITPFVQPPDLDGALAARGYAPFETTLVQALSLAAAPGLRALPAGVALTEPDGGTFVDVVGDLRGSPPPQRAAHGEWLEESLLRRRFVILRAGDRIAGAGQIAVDGDLAGIFDVVTAADARGRGHATHVCAALLAWGWRQGARTAYLQVSADNGPAIALYRRFGFATLYTYHYRGRPGECR